MTYTVFPMLSLSGLHQMLFWSWGRVLQQNSRCEEFTWEVWCKKLPEKQRRLVKGDALLLSFTAIHRSVEGASRVQRATPAPTRWFRRSYATLLPSKPWKYWCLSKRVVNARNCLSLYHKQTSSYEWTGVREGHLLQDGSGLQWEYNRDNWENTHWKI